MGRAGGGGGGAILPGTHPGRRPSCLQPSPTPSAQQGAEPVVRPGPPPALPGWPPSSRWPPTPSPDIPSWFLRSLWVAPKSVQMPRAGGVGQPLRLPGPCAEHVQEEGRWTTLAPCPPPTITQPCQLAQLDLQWRLLLAGQEGLPQLLHRRPHLRQCPVAWRSSKAGVSSETTLEWGWGPRFHGQPRARPLHSRVPIPPTPGASELQLPQVPLHSRAMLLGLSGLFPGRCWHPSSQH